MKDLSTDIVQPFNSEGIKTLGGLKYKRFSLETENDMYPNLKTLWKCKQLVYPNAPL